MTYHRRLAALEMQIHDASIATGIVQIIFDGRASLQQRAAAKAAKAKGMQVIEAHVVDQGMPETAFL